MTQRTFSLIMGEERDGFHIVLPFDPKAVFGKGRPPVKVTIGGHTYRSTIATMNGAFMIPLSAENRTAAGR